MATKRFRIAFSFAGEKRDFVRKVAELLASRFGRDKILYDKFHEAEFSRSDLAFHLPDLYEKESDLIVAVICPDYDKKLWCGLEWNAIFGLLKKGLVDLVMLTRFNHAEAKGLRGLAGYTDLDHLNEKQACELILQRLAINEGLAQNIYAAPTTKKRKQPKQKNPANVNLTTETNARHTIPNNLPVLPHFFGRAEELKKIAGALLPKARTWGVLIDGPGGMGKTSLAIRAAELAPPGEFQRILFLSAKEREMTADGEKRLDGYILQGYLAMLNEIASLLKQPKLAKSTEQDRPRLILDALSGTHTLLILDNLESLTPEHRDQLFTFLSHLPPGCKAIVTSRRRTDIDARIIRLEKLDRDAALAYLAELAVDRPHLQKATLEQRESIYTETGGNPLVIRWIAGQLGRGKCRTVSTALNFLRNAPTGNNPLEYIFGDLLDTLTIEETKVLCSLSHLPGLSEIKYIADISGLSFTATTITLEELTDRSLVIASPTDELYILTPLVADYLRRARPESVAETACRLENRAFDLITENGWENHERFIILETAWPMLAASIPLFLSGKNNRLQEICAALFRFMDFTGRWDEMLSLCQQAEKKAVAENDYQSAGWRAYHAGTIHSNRAEAEPTLTCALRAEKHWTEINAGMREQAIAIGLRGLGNRLKKDYPAAITAYREALTLDKNLSPESEDVAIDLNALAEVERISGDIVSAERDYREALRVAISARYDEGVAGFSSDLADLALDSRKWAEAEALARKALPLVEKVGRLELIAANCSRLAKALSQQGKFTEALPHARRSVQLFKQLNSPGLEYAKALLTECESQH